MTINAIASVSGQLLSPPGHGYLSTRTPRLSLSSSVCPRRQYSACKSSRLSDPTGNAAIYYTVDGSTPIGTGTTEYSFGLRSLSTTETITAIAVAPGIHRQPCRGRRPTPSRKASPDSFPRVSLPSTD